MSHVVTYDKAKTQDVKPPLGDDPDGRSHEGRDVFTCVDDDDEDDDDDTNTVKR